MRDRGRRPSERSEVARDLRAEETEASRRFLSPAPPAREKRPSRKSWFPPAAVAFFRGRAAAANAYATPRCRPPLPAGALRRPAAFGAFSAPSLDDDRALSSLSDLRAGAPRPAAATPRHRARLLAIVRFGVRLHRLGRLVARVVED